MLALTISKSKVQTFNINSDDSFKGNKVWRIARNEQVYDIVTPESFLNLLSLCFAVYEPTTTQLIDLSIFDDIDFADLCFAVFDEPLSYADALVDRSNG